VQKNADVLRLQMVNVAEEKERRERRSGAAHAQ
jgi:hypothetical protein